MCARSTLGSSRVGGRCGACTPYKVAVPEETLVDLRERLGRTRFVDEFAGGGWRYGVSRSYLQELCEYWRTTFDWRAQEAILNSFDQFQMRVDGQPIHFIHARSSNPAALPLLLVHGWPGSIFEFVKVIGPLCAGGARRRREGRVPRRGSFNTRLRVLGADHRARLGSAAHRRGLRRVDGQPGLRPLRSGRR